MVNIGRAMGQKLLSDGEEQLRPILCMEKALSSGSIKEKQGGW